MIRCSALLFLLVLTGCAQDNYEQVTTEYLDVMKQVVSTCDSISTEEDAKTKKEELGGLLNQLKKLRDRTASLGEADDKTRTTIESRYQQQFQSLAESFSSSIRKIEQNPKVAVELETEMKTLAKLVNARPLRIRR